MTLIRFEGSDDRGPSGTLWNSLVDWVTGTLAVQSGVTDTDDFWPYGGALLGSAVQSGGITLSTDAGSAAAVQAVPFGEVNFTATIAADAVAGYYRNSYVDFSDARQVCREVYLESIADATDPQTFIGWADTIPISLFGADGVVDGSALGLLWNADETVDLIAVASDDTLTVLYHEVATGILRTDGKHKFGVRVKKETATQYSVFASVNGVVKVARTALVPGAPMFPIVAQYIDGTTAPSFDVDWDANVDATPA